MGSGLTISQKQNSIRDNIRKKTSDVQNCQNYAELENFIKSSFTEEENKYLEERSIQNFFENELHNIWIGIQRNREKIISDKLIQISRDQTFSSKDELKEHLFKFLNEEEHYFVKNNEKTQEMLDKIWLSNEKKLKKKMDDFKNSLDEKISRICYLEGSSIISLEQFKSKFESNIGPEERSFLNDFDIKMIYNRRISYFWGIINAKNDESIKNIFYSNIKYIIERIYRQRPYTQIEVLENDIINSLSEKEKNFLNRENPYSFDQKIYDFFKDTLTRFWNDVLREKKNIKENKKTKIKDKIADTIEP